MLGLEKYQELNDLIVKKDVMDDSDYIFLIIATYALNKKNWEKLALECQNKHFKDSYLNYNISHQTLPAAQAKSRLVQQL